MSKFLELVEENTPGAGVGPFTVEYKDAEGTVMSILTIPDDVGSSYENFLDFAKGSGGSLEVVDQPVEDTEAKVLKAREKEALDVATSLVKDPRRRSFQLDPKKQLERSVGDMYKGIAKRVKAIAKKIK